MVNICARPTSTSSRPSRPSRWATSPTRRAALSSARLSRPRRRRRPDEQETYPDRRNPDGTPSARTRWQGRTLPYEMGVKLTGHRVVHRPPKPLSLPRPGVQRAGDGTGRGLRDRRARRRQLHAVLALLKAGETVTRTTARRHDREGLVAGRHVPGHAARRRRPAHQGRPAARPDGRLRGDHAHRHRGAQRPLARGSLPRLPGQLRRGLDPLCVRHVQGPVQAVGRR